jgi:hypothetical protein
VAAQYGRGNADRLVRVMNGRTLVQQISDILASTKADKVKAQHVARKLGREWGSISGSIRRFAPFREMLTDTGFEYVHRIWCLGSYFERKRRH